MIQTIVTHPCPECGSENMVRNGHDYKGAQKYCYHDCDSYGTLHAQRGHHEYTRTQVKHAVLERISLRGIERVFDVSWRTVLAWIEQWVEHLPPLDTTFCDAQLDDVLELDEVWSFVLKKTNKRWVWAALCRRTRQSLNTSRSTVERTRKRLVEEGSDKALNEDPRPGNGPSGMASPKRTSSH